MKIKGHMSYVNPLLKFQQIDNIFQSNIFEQLSNKICMASSESSQSLYLNFNINHSCRLTKPVDIKLQLRHIILSGKWLSHPTRNGGIVFW